MALWAVTWVFSSWMYCRVHVFGSAPATGAKATGDTVNTAAIRAETRTDCLLMAAPFLAVPGTVRQRAP